MLKKISLISFYLKVILLLVTFSFTMYIIFSKNALSMVTASDFVLIMIPFTLTLLCFILSFFFTRGRDNTFFNVSCLVAIFSLMVMCIRTISDSNMVMWNKWQMNIYFFDQQIEEFKLLLYLMSIGNIILIFKVDSSDENFNDKKIFNN